MSEALLLAQTVTLQVDIAQLRKVSAVKGLVNNEVHAHLTFARGNVFMPATSCPLDDRGACSAYKFLWR